jgi:hypothetical protein
MSRAELIESIRDIAQVMATSPQLHVKLSGGFLLLTESLVELEKTPSRAANVDRRSSAVRQQTRRAMDTHVCDPHKNVAALERSRSRTARCSSKRTHRVVACDLLPSPSCIVGARADSRARLLSGFSKFSWWLLRASLAKLVA